MPLFPAKQISVCHNARAQTVPAWCLFHICILATRLVKRSFAVCAISQMTAHGFVLSSKKALTLAGAKGAKKVKGTIKVGCLPPPIYRHLWHISP